MDREQHRDAQARLESDYLAGTISAEDYTRLRHQLHESLTGLDEQSEHARTAQRGIDSVTGLRLASWGRRAAALVVDWLVLVVVIVLVSIWTFTTTDPVTDEPGDVQTLAFFFVLLILPSLYQWLMLGARGQTLGKMAFQERVVRAEDGGRAGYARAAGRVASAWVLGLLFVPLLLAYLWPLWDRRNQTLYDKMASTIVVRA